MVSFKQTGFAGGIIGPQLRGKTVQEKYQTGLEECLNWVITRFGSAENRAGTQYVGEVKDSSQTVREVPFIFNASISYLLEFGDGYIRPWRSGARISVAGAAPWLIGTPYHAGDLVTYGGVVYRAFGNTTGQIPPAFPGSWDPQEDDLLEIFTNVPQDSLSTMQYVQQNDVMTVVEQAFAPAELTRYSDTKWTWAPVVVSTGIEPPTGLAVSAGNPVGSSGATVTATGGNVLLQKNRYIVVSVLGVSAQQFIPSSPALSTVGGADALNAVTVDWNNPYGSTTTAFRIYKLTGTVYRLIGSTAAGTLTFSDDASVTPSEILQLGSNNVVQYDYAVTAISAATGAESLISATASVDGYFINSELSNVITWTPSAGASSYRVYRGNSGVFSFIGPAASSPFSDTGISPNEAIHPPVTISGLFLTSSDYPGSVGYYQQRLLLGNTINEPQTVVASNTGVYSNFTVASPVDDSSAVEFTIAGKQVQEVRALIDLGKLIIHTSGDEYVCTGNQSGALTPTGIGLVHQGSAGCSTIAPIVIGNCGIFVQARGSVLRDLEYSIYTTSFKGRDLTVFAPHLFVGRTIVDMAWQQIPDSIVWCVMSDGALLGLTYIKDHEIWAWHRHDSDGGSFENVVVVPEGEQDVVYFVIRRTIDGITKRYIERLNSRDFTNIVDARFVDSGLTYDGRNGTATTMTATTAGGWTPQDDLTLTASAPFFAVDDVGNSIVFQEIADGSQQNDAGVYYPPGTVISWITFDIIAYTSATVVTVQSDAEVPAWARVALATWGKAVHQFSGIDHLEGETISGLGDGNVIPQTTVVSGAFTTQDNIMVLTVGLPITADLQTLPIENQQGETISNKKMLVVELTPIFYNSRGGEYGQDFAHLKPWIQRQNEPWNRPVSLYTGPERLPITGMWQKTGQIAIRQEDPLPIGISAIVPTGSVGN